MKKILAVLTSILTFTLFSCTEKQNKFVIWTDRAEIASYAELFNAENEFSKAVIVYKENIATHLPPAKDEVKPDLIIGSLLNNSKMTKEFISLNSLLDKKDEEGNIDENKIDEENFYSSLLSYGNFEEKLYLIPVSFNLPIMIFSDKNKDLLSDDRVIDLKDVKDSAEKFNKQNKNKIYTKMGFAPSWDSQFIYTVAKMNGADFQEKGNMFIWNEYSLKNTIDFMKDWTMTKNTSTTAEEDFSFKYLYTPKYKQIISGSCLLAYTTTETFFSLAPEQIAGTDFRWLTKDGKVYAEDNITMAGIYKKSDNKSEAKKFLLWLFDDEKQKALIDRNRNMKLGTETFGLCCGFSSMKSVNERYFPTYYKNLMGNLPSEKSIRSPLPLPPRWESLKERVLIPYLSEATKTEGVKKMQTIDERLKTWAKQFN